MPDVPFATRAYRRDKGGLPEFRLLNMLVEESPSAGAGAALIGREGLGDVATWGNGPVHEVFQQDGVFDGDRFAISGNTIYREGVSLGTIDGSGEAWFACSPVELCFGRGKTAYSYDGDTVEAIAFPDGAGVRWGVYLATLFFFVRDGDAPLNGRVYFSSPLDGRSVDDLDFFNAESAPDQTLQVLVVGDNLAVLGRKTIEFWRLTGQLTLPVSRISQRLFTKGIKNTGAAVSADNSMLFVSDENRLHRIADVPQVMSDFALGERFEESSTARLFRFSYMGHDLVAARTDTGTWIYDAATGETPEFATLGRTNWRAKCACMVSGRALLGDDTSGALLEFSGFEDGAEQLQRVCSIYFPVTGGSAHVDSLEVELDFGHTQELSGEGADPIVEMRSSRDGGRNWTPWRGTTVGRQGKYGTRARWRRLGIFNSPGGLFELRAADPAPFRISRAFVNEPAGGRQR